MLRVTKRSESFRCERQMAMKQTSTTKTLATSEDEAAPLSQANFDGTSFRIGKKIVSRSEWQTAVRGRVAKQRISIMLDAPIIARYKAIAGERGYQTLINDTLRRAVEGELAAIRDDEGGNFLGHKRHSFLTVRFSDAMFPGFKRLRVQRFSDSKTFRFKDLQIQRPSDSKTSRFKDQPCGFFRTSGFSQCDSASPVEGIVRVSRTGVVMGVARPPA